MADILRNLGQLVLDKEGEAEDEGQSGRTLIRPTLRRPSLWRHSAFRVDVAGFVQVIAARTDLLF